MKQFSCRLGTFSEAGVGRFVSELLSSKVLAWASVRKRKRKRKRMGKRKEKRKRKRKKKKKKRKTRSRGFL